MKKKKIIFYAIIALSLLLVLSGCSGKELSQEEADKYQDILKEYYKFYQAGDFEEAIKFFGKKFEYEEGGQKYVGADVIKAAINKNQLLKHDLKILSMENTNGGILVSLENSTHLLKISGIEPYKSYEFFVFKNDLINSVTATIDEDDYIYTTKMVEADPGLILGLEDNIIKIMDFTDDSPALEAGLKKGSQLLAVDDVAVEDFELGISEATYRLAGRTETEVKIKVKEDNEIKEYNLSRTK